MKTRRERLQRLSQQDKQSIVELYDKGHTSGYLAGLFKVTQSAITYTIRRARQQEG